MEFSAITRNNAKKPIWQFSVTVDMENEDAVLSVCDVADESNVQVTFSGNDIIILSSHKKTDIQTVYDTLRS